MLKLRVKTSHVLQTVVGEILVPDEGENDGGRGVCVRNPCPRAHLYFPDPGGVSAGRRHRLEGAAGTCHKVRTFYYFLSFFGYLCFKLPYSEKKC